ncbi:hypothetical protein E0D97_17160 [Oricola cellulosilytica]|uniref:Outer membrane beta-barrel protein n=1 Tax=Oricola cellulosilytica TaxID=1429082 RepID=A0A4R0P7G8_9HYPH|nr:hypothetical protein E0D97_17160 [Oricola cellulosilytica]
MKTSAIMRGGPGGCLALALLLLSGAADASAQEFGTLRGRVAEDVLNQPGGRSAPDDAGDRGGIRVPEYRPLGTGTAPDGEAAGRDGIAFDPLEMNTGEDGENAARPNAGSDGTTASDGRISSVPGRVGSVGSIPSVQGGGGQPESDPYAPVGTRIGSFILRSTLDLGLSSSRETTTFASGTPPVAAESTSISVLGDGALRLDLDSDWSRHALNVDALGRLQRDISDDGDRKIEPEVLLDAVARIDVREGTTVTATAGYAYRLDDAQSAAFYAATDPALVPAVSGTNDPPTQTLDGSLSLRQDFRSLFGEAGVSVERTLHGAAELSDGSSISQNDLDNTVYDGRLRAGFELSPVFSPFVEVGYGIRRMDERPDSGGMDRNAVRYAARAGTGIDLGEKLNGEVAIGYLREDVADPLLEDIDGIALDALVNWSPRRETDVTLRLATTTETSSVGGESGALLYSGDLAVTHRIRANLSAEASLGADFRDVRGGADETTVAGQTGLTYWFNRFAGLTTRLRHEETYSSDPLERSTTTSAFVGLRLQH